MDSSLNIVKSYHHKRMTHREVNDTSYGHSTRHEMMITISLLVLSTE